MRTRLLAPLLLSLLVIAFYWKLAFTDEFLWMESPDLAYQVLPWLQFQAAEWHAGRIPLWDPYHWAGQPLAGQMQPGFANPLNWVLFLAPLRDGWLRFTALNWYFIGIHMVAAWLAYWLCRDRGLGRPASVFGGMAFSLSGWLGNTTWPQMLCGAVWTPAVFLYLFRAVEGNRPVASSLLSGFFLGLAWLSGHHQAPIFLTLAALAMWLYSALVRALPIRTAFICTVIFLISMGLTGGLQTVPAAEYARLALRWTGAPQPTGWGDAIPYFVHQNLSLLPVGALGVLTSMPELNVNPLAGVTIAALAVLGVAAGWRERWIRVLAAMSALSFTVALGTYTPLHGVLYSVIPMVEKARAAYTPIFIFNFGLCLLAACGAKSLCDQHDGFLPRRAGLILLVLAAAAAAGAFGLHAVGKPQAAHGLAASTVAALATGILLSAAARGQLSPSCLFTGLVLSSLFELTVGGMLSGLPNRYMPGREGYLDRLAGLAPTVEFLRTQPRPFRISVDRDHVPFNLGDWHGIETSGGYLASLTSNTYQVDVHNSIWNKILGVRFHLSKSPRDEFRQVVFEDPSGLRLYENPDVFARAWIVHEIAELNSRLEVADFIRSHPDKLQKTAPATFRGLSLQRCQGNEGVRVVENVPGRTVLEAELACPGMVVLSEVYYPGWVARVNGKHATIHEVYGCLRGITAGAGRHRIEFLYRPGSVLAGAVMTATGWLAALAAALGRRRRSHP